MIQNENSENEHIHENHDIIGNNQENVEIIQEWNHDENKEETELRTNTIQE